MSFLLPFLARNSIYRSQEAWLVQAEPSVYPACAYQCPLLASNNNMAIDYNHSNPVFEGHVTGSDKGAHSSETKSVARQANAQSDDAITDVSRSQDPNISGTPEMGQMYPWRAGALSAWQENDDYRQFFERGDVGESATTHRHNTVHDHDYDDNRGIPLEFGEVHGYPGEPRGDKNQSHGTIPTAKEFPLGPVIERRV